jgi:hypothetical protein
MNGNMVKAFALGAALVSAGLVEAQAQDNRGNFGTPQTQPQPGGGVTAGPGAPTSAVPASPVMPGRGAPTPGSVGGGQGGAGTGGPMVTGNGAITPGNPAQDGRSGGG